MELMHLLTSFALAIGVGHHGNSDIDHLPVELRCEIARHMELREFAIFTKSKATVNYRNSPSIVAQVFFNTYGTKALVKAIESALGSKHADVIRILLKKVDPSDNDNEA